jgi:hypothetical protein
VVALLKGFDLNKSPFLLKSEDLIKNGTGLDNFGNLHISNNLSISPTPSDDKISVLL